MRASTLLLVCLLASASRADEIYRTDGKVLKDVTVTEETLTQVLFKKGSSQQSVSSDEILSITYSKKPRLVDEGDQAEAEDDPVGALDILDQYVDGQINKPTERKKWAPPYAAWRTVELAQLLDDVAGVAKRVDRLIKNFPDSRFVPAAYLARASAEARLGKPGAAQGTLNDLLALVQAKSLSKRWELEAELGLILTDVSTAGASKRDELQGIIGKAGSQFPTVGNRAQVAVGETYLAEIDAASEQKRAELAAAAGKVFTAIVKDQKADSQTLAAAFTGLGTALFHQGKSEESLMNFLRVIVLYEAHSQYVSQSMFYAMLCFRQDDSPQSRDRYREMKWKLEQRYPESTWAKQAKGY